MRSCMTCQRIEGSESSSHCRTDSWSASLAMRHEDACDIARQRDAGTGSGNAEPVKLTQRKEAPGHGEPDDEQKGRLKQQVSVRHCQKAVDQTEEHRPHAVAGIEANPGPPHRRF